MLPTLRRSVFDFPFAAIDRDFDKIVRGWFGEANGRTGVYPVDIHEDADNVYVEAELPGFNKEDVNVTLEDGVLTITAQRRAREDREESQTHLRERRITQVMRSFTLPSTVNEGQVEAALQDGVLKVTLHKREESKPRRINVS